MSSSEEEDPKPSLPEDLLLSCIARVSRLYYPTFSLVSKSFRSLIASPELYKARSLLGHNESCLYVCLDFCSYRRWYTLFRKPDQTVTNVDIIKENLSGCYLTRVPIPPCPPRARYSNFPRLVAVGSDIYDILDSPSSHVSVLDCMSHTWRECPSHPVALNLLAASVVDRNIYVAGSYKDGDCVKGTVQVLDTTTQRWNPVPPIPFGNDSRTGYYFFHSACIDGNIHVEIGDDVVSYNSKECRWDLLVGERMGYDMFRNSSYCVIDNVFYSAFGNVLWWYDTEERRWRKLLGLEELPTFSHPSYIDCITLVDYGGKMAVLYDVRCFGGFCENFTNMICCAVIVLQRGKSCEISGKVEWSDNVFTASNKCYLLKALAVTV